MKRAAASPMKILALEFSSERRSVAIVDGDATDSRLLGRAEEIGGRNVQAIALIENVLVQARCEIETIDCIAVATGPGSYTGIRAAIALAQGWQLGRKTKLLGISSVECIAQQALADGVTGPVHIVIDAQRNEFYLASFEITSGRLQNTEPLRIASFDEVQQHLKKNEPVIGPGIEKQIPSSKDYFADAAMLGRIALADTNFAAGEKLEPIYLREVSFVKTPPRRSV